MYDQETLDRLNELHRAIENQKSDIAWYVAACSAEGRDFHPEDLGILRARAAELERLHAEAMALVRADDEPVPFVPAEATS